MDNERVSENDQRPPVQPGRGRVSCLSGYVVLDLTAYLAGPFATEILAALGATVIKVEPLRGDFLRHGNAPWATREGPTLEQPQDEELVALRFLKRNQAKLSIALDLKTPAGVGVLHRLVKSADAFIHNFKPATAARLRVSATDLQQINPRLVYCSLDGLGKYSEERDERPVIDQAVQALSGVMTGLGSPDDPPLYLALPVGDLSGGLYAAIAVLAGLLGRDGRRGKEKASSFSVSLLGALSAMVWDRPLDGSTRFKLPERTGRTTQGYLVNRLFETGDQKWIYISGISQDQWLRIVAATEIPELASPEYEELSVRLADQALIEELLVQWAAGLTRDEVLQRLLARGVSAWPVRNAADVVGDDRFRQAFLYEVEHPVHGPTGMLDAVSPIVADHEDDLMEDAPAPLLGQHTHAVLREFAQLSDDEIEELERAGVVPASADHTAAVAAPSKRLPSRA